MVGQNALTKILFVAKLTSVQQIKPQRQQNCNIFVSFWGSL